MTHKKIWFTIVGLALVVFLTGTLLESPVLLGLSIVIAVAAAPFAGWVVK